MMNYFVARTNGVITGLYACEQDVAAEVLPENNDEVVAFLNPPQPSSSITKRQLCLTLVRNGIPLSSVETAINAMPDGLQKSEAQIEWEDASYFSRNHPTLLLVAEALGLHSSQVDEMWSEAVLV